MDRLKWLQDRQKGIGSSDTPALFGLDEYRTPVDVFLSKVTPIEDVPEMTERQRIGLELEPALVDIVLQRYVEKHPGTVIERIGKEHETYTHPRYEHMLASPDEIVAINGELADVSIKTTSHFLAHKWEGNNVPDYAQVQSQHMMEAIPHLRFSLIGALVFTPTIELRLVEKDEAIGATILDKCKDFWQQHVETRQPPAGGSSSGLLALYPSSDDRSVLLPPTYEEDIKRYIKLRDAMKEMKGEQEEIACRLKEELKEAKHGELFNYRVTWSRFKQKRLDTKRLFEENPSINKEDYEKEVNTSRLTIRQEE